jgi:hypothetical protein
MGWVRPRRVVGRGFSLVEDGYFGMDVNGIYEDA